MWKIVLLLVVIGGVVWFMRRGGCCGTGKSEDQSPDQKPGCH